MRRQLFVGVAECLGRPGDSNFVSVQRLNGVRSLVHRLGSVRRDTCPSSRDLSAEYVAKDGRSLGRTPHLTMRNASETFGRAQRQAYDQRRRRRPSHRHSSARPARGGGSGLRPSGRPPSS